MKIKELYSSKLTLMSNQLNNLFTKLGMIDYNIESLNKLKNNISKNILKINDNKNTLIKEISLLYGQGYIDPNTWLFHPTKNEE